MPPVRRPSRPRRPARLLVPLLVAAWAAAGGVLRARPLAAQTAGAPPGAAPAGTAAPRPDSLGRASGRGGPDAPGRSAGADSATARLRVRLVDATGRPAVGAVVRLDATRRQGTADSAGVVEFAGLAPGTYTGTAVDPRLAALGLGRPAPLRVAAARGATAEARVEVETADVAAAARCARDAPPGPPGARLLGRVEGAGGRPAGGARWQVVDLQGRVLASGGPVGRDGLFHWCGLPARTPARVEAWRDVQQVAGVPALLDGLTTVRVSLVPRGGAAPDGPDTSSVAVGGGRTLERLFAGRFPGVDVSQAAGGGLRIRIRGGANSFIAGEEPLYVVDGTPLPPGTGGIVFLNPYDIEQIEVLKNPADVGIYGVRGGNGVIRITTVRPR